MTRARYIVYKTLLCASRLGIMVYIYEESISF
jgi:hypothetical protein